VVEKWDHVFIVGLLVMSTIIVMTRDVELKGTIEQLVNQNFLTVSSVKLMIERVCGRIQPELRTKHIYAQTKKNNLNSIASPKSRFAPLNRL